MDLYDPYAYAVVRLDECEQVPASPGYVACRPFGRDHWFLTERATGRTSRMAPAAVAAVRLLTEDAEAADPLFACDAASLTADDVGHRALFVAAPRRVIDALNLPLSESAPPPAFDVPPADPADAFSRARGLYEAVAQRRGLVVDTQGMSVAEVDAAVTRLKRLGYDTYGLVVGEGGDPVAIRKAFGNDRRVRHVEIEDVPRVRDAALSLLSRPRTNPKGKAERDARSSRTARRSPLAGAFSPPPPRKRFVPRAVERARAAAKARRAETTPAIPSVRPPVMHVRESFDAAEDPHDKADGWKLPAGYDWKKLAYGVVVTDGRGRVLLREPENHFDGYVWTFPKGKKDKADEPPATVAKREAAEETGVHGHLTGYVPGSYKGGTSYNYYFTMLATRSNADDMDDETHRTRWVTPDEAALLIGMTKNSMGRQRDLDVLAAAAKALRLPYSGPAKAPEKPAEPTKAKELFKGPGKLANAFNPAKPLNLNGPVGSQPPVNKNPWAPKPYKPKFEGLDEADGGGLARQLANYAKQAFAQRYALEVVRPIALYKARKTYDRAAAPRLARHLIVAAGRALARAKKLPGLWHSHFTPPVREKAEVLMRGMGEKDAASRKYDKLLPKKWQKGFKGYAEGEATGDAAAALDGAVA